jgi:endonuclease G
MNRLAIVAGTLLLVVAALAAGDKFNPHGRPLGYDDQGCKLLVKRAYECFHDPHLRISRWAAYRANCPGSNNLGRPNNFHSDSGLTREERATNSDYLNSGYDKGHQAPDAIIKYYGEAEQKQTYSLANMTPQWHRTNNGVWKKLESKIRAWSSQKPVWVVTGPVFFPGADTAWIPKGKKRVAVPHAYFAILSRGSKPDVISFLVRNQSEPFAAANLNRFLVSVDSLETLTRLDFLSGLPDAKEKAFEAKVPEKIWP